MIGVCVGLTAANASSGIGLQWFVGIAGTSSTVRAASGPPGAFRSGGLGVGLIHNLSPFAAVRVTRPIEVALHVVLSVIRVAVAVVAKVVVAVTGIGSVGTRPSVGVTAGGGALINISGR